MDEQGMLQGTRNKTGASQPLLSEGMVSSIVGNPFQRLWHFSAKQSAMPSLIFMGKYSNNGGRRPKADPSVNRYVVRFNVEENARFLSMSEQSEDINKAAFIKNFLFQKPFKVFVVDENTRISHQSVVLAECTLSNLWWQLRFSSREFQRKEMFRS